MATSPRPQHLGEDVEEDFDFDTSNSKLPGYTVDALLSQGKVDEARAELERLLQEGIDSGISPESPADMMKRIRAKVRTRAANR
jgi:hypothetical protein